MPATEPTPSTSAPCGDDCTCSCQDEEELGPTPVMLVHEALEYAREELGGSRGYTMFVAGQSPKHIVPITSLSVALVTDYLLAHGAVLAGITRGPWVNAEKLFPKY